MKLYTSEGYFWTKDLWRDSRREKKRSAEKAKFKNQENAKFYLSYRYDDPNIEGRKLELTTITVRTDVIPW